MSWERGTHERKEKCDKRRESEEGWFQKQKKTSVSRRVSHVVWNKAEGPGTDKDTEVMGDFCRSIFRAGGPKANHGGWGANRRWTTVSLVSYFVFLNLDRERKDMERMAILCLQDLKDLDEILYFISMGAIYILEDWKRKANIKKKGGAKRRGSGGSPRIRGQGEGRTGSEWEAKRTHPFMQDENRQV